MTVAEAPALTDEQLRVVGKIADWYYGRPKERMTVGGLAGTGKTTVANQIPELLEVPRSRVSYCSFTGKAASRLVGGTTIHRLIYRRVEFHDPACPCYRLDEETEDDKEMRERAKCADLPECGFHFERKERIEDSDLVIVDEASMVNEYICKDLSSFGVPVLWIGDHGQLPPVKSQFNLMENPILKLEEIHRQAEGSAILDLALHARKFGKIPFGVFGDGVAKYQVIGERLPLSASALERKLILCGKNRTRCFVNAAARAHRGFPGNQPVAGDRVVCLRNSYDDGVFNGQVGEVIEAQYIIAEEAFKLKILIDGEEKPVDVLALPEQFGAQKTVSFPPRGIGLWDYGYALTVHKAQGSEAEDVVLLEERLYEVDHARWLYTGITRAKRTLEVHSRR